MPQTRRLFPFLPGTICSETLDKSTSNLWRLIVTTLLSSCKKNLTFLNGPQRDPPHQTFFAYFLLYYPSAKCLTSQTRYCSQSICYALETFLFFVKVLQVLDQTVAYLLRILFLTHFVSFVHKVLNHDFIYQQLPWKVFYKPNFFNFLYVPGTIGAFHHGLL